MKKWLLFVAIWGCMAFSCVPEESDTFHRSIKVTNNADYPVYFAYHWISPDWNPDIPQYGYIEDDYRVNPNETNTITILEGANSIEGWLYTGRRKFRIYFVDAEIFDQLSHGPVPEEALLDSRIYNVEDLRAVNFHINYPLE